MYTISSVYKTFYMTTQSYFFPPHLCRDTENGCTVSHGGSRAEKGDLKGILLQFKGIPRAQVQRENEGGKAADGWDRIQL